MAELNSDDKAFADLALKLGKVTVAQLARADEGQRRVTKAGHRISLADVLVKLGTLTPDIRDGIQRQVKQAGVRKLGQYRVLEPLGKGAMGAVFLAEDEMMKRTVAVKILPKRLSADEQFLGRFRREAKAAGILNHINICGAFAVGEEDGLHYYVMEYCRGESLGERLKREKTIPWPKALDILLQSAAGLAYAHTHGFVHRDIKPDNLMVDDDGAIKILDLGLAKNIDPDDDSAELTQMGSAVGTPHYISPEQARGEEKIDGRTDIYSLGATFYHLLTGRTPFKGPTAAAIMTRHITDPVPDPRDHVAELPEGVSRIILKMMAKDPDDRYPECDSLEEDLRCVRENRPLLAHASPTVPDDRSNRVRRITARQRPVSAKTTSHHRPIDRSSLRSTRRRTTVLGGSVSSRVKGGDSEGVGEETRGTHKAVIAVTAMAVVLAALGVALLARSTKPGPGRVAKPTVAAREDGGRKTEIPSPHDASKSAVSKGGNSSEPVPGDTAADRPKPQPEPGPGSNRSGTPPEAGRAGTLAPATPPASKTPTPSTDVRKGPGPDPTPPKAQPQPAVEKLGPGKVVAVQDVPLASLKPSRLVLHQAFRKQFEVATTEALPLHPPTDGSALATYDLQERFRTFRCSVVNTNKAWSGALAFKVHGNGKVLWTSKPITQGVTPQACEIDVEGVGPFTIEVACKGSSHGAHAQWRNAMLVPVDAPTKEERATALAVRAKADAKLARQLQAVEACLADRDLAGIKAIRDAARKDPELQPLDEQVRALSAVVDALDAAMAAERKAFRELTVGARRTFHTLKGLITGTVTAVDGEKATVAIEASINNKPIEYKRSIRLSDLTETGRERLLGGPPDSPDGWTAEAIRRSALGQKEAANMAFAKAGDHALAKWCREHGGGAGTTDVKTSDPPAEETSETPEHLTELSGSVVQKLFKGRITKYESAALRATVEYDFTNPVQLEDFEAPRVPSAAASSVRCMPSGLLLRCAGHGPVLATSRFSARNVAVRMRFDVGGLKLSQGYLSVWLGYHESEDRKPRTYGPLGNVFSAWKTSCGFSAQGGTGAAAGKGYVFAEMPLTDHGTLVLSKREENLTATLNGKPLLAGRTTEQKPHPSFGLGGGSNFAYTIQRLEISGQLDAAWLDRARRLLEPLKATRADMKRIFKGEILSFDKRTATIDITYDFQDAAQLEDWALPAGGNGTARLDVADGALRLAQVQKPVLMKGVFRSAALSTDCASKQAITLASVCVHADGSGNGYAFLYEQTQCSLRKHLTSRAFEIARKKYTRASIADRITFSVVCGNGQLGGQLGRLGLKAKSTDFDRGRVGVWGAAEIAFDNIRVKGVLDKAWLLDALEKAKAPAGSDP